MSLLKEITEAAIDTSIDISVLLRKCKVLAARLGNKDFDTWVEHELNGYKSVKELPSYRILKKVQSHGNFIGSRLIVKDIAIPPSTIPEEYRVYITEAYSLDAISYYSNLIKNTDKKGVYAENWDADFIRVFGSKIFNDMECTGAWKVIPEGFIASLLDNVRNRVLSFALEIEKEAPDAGEADILLPIKTGG